MKFNFGRKREQVEQPEPEPEPEEHPLDAFDGGLASELQEVLERVGPAGYARATAKEFAPGGRYAPPKPRQKYALM